MLAYSKNRILVAVAFALLLLAGSVVWLLTHQTETEVEEMVEVETTEEIDLSRTEKIVGVSVEGRNIRAYSFGTGATNVLFVGGIHGGYEWNSSLLAYKMIDYLEANLDFIPSDITVTIIPSANPDGLFRVTGSGARFALEDIIAPDVVGAGRFNANGVDLNRNFDCKWQPKSAWRGDEVSAGDSAFSEPEAVAVRDLVYELEPAVVVFWHSQANAVYASECEEGILPDTLKAMSVYSVAAEYKAIDSFDAYPVTGDAEGWLASIGVPAITVELSTHETVEWEQNLAGTKAVLNYFSADK